MGVPDVGQTCILVIKRVCLMSLRKEIEVIVKGGRVYAVLEHDDVGVIDDLMRDDTRTVQDSDGLRARTAADDRNVMGG